MSRRDGKAPRYIAPGEVPSLPLPQVLMRIATEAVGRLDIDTLTRIGPLAEFLTKTRKRPGNRARSGNRPELQKLWLQGRANTA